MSTVRDVFICIDSIAPFSSAMEFDNVGILVGDPNLEVKRLMITLDLTLDIVKEAESKNVDLIVSHHPVIFSPMRSLGADTVPYRLARSGIAVISCHTNLDIAPEYGVNAMLARQLQLQNAVALYNDLGQVLPIVMGSLDYEQEPNIFATAVKLNLISSGVRFCQGNHPIKLVAVSSGAGGEYVKMAHEHGADAFVTGEIKYHDALEAKHLGITVVEVGHYESEVGFKPVLLEYLRRQIKDVGFVLSKSEEPTMTNI